MTNTVDDHAKAVLNYWCVELPPSKHFVRDDKVDTEIRDRFGALHTELASGVSHEWRSTKERRLAAIIVLDQWSRNLFRGDGRAFAQDALARELANGAIASGDLDRLPQDRATYIIMPLMHSEHLIDVERSIVLLERIGAVNSARFGRLHRDSIIRFGRYPARNRALGRESTPAELAFLAKNPSGF